VHLLCGLPLVGLGEFPLAELPPLAHATSAEKAVRDSFGDFPNAVESDNFAVKWGSRGSLSAEDATRLAEAFELAWEVEVEAMGYPLPTGSDRYKFNVYLGDSGDGAPASYGAAGYYNRDREGMPYIVIAPETVSGGYYETTAAHEFFHAIQDVTRAYTYDGVDAWFWEATAMWVEGEVHPTNPDWYVFLFGYALLPQYPVHFFDYPDTGALQEYHQYGAAVWPRFLTEHMADASVVHDAWVDAQGATPQASLAAALEDRGLDIGDAFARFAAHNAVWDYADGRGMEEWVEAYARYYTREDASVVGELDALTDGWFEAPDETLPQAYGVNTVAWDAEPGPVRVRFEAAAVGDAGSGASWGVTVVTQTDRVPTYTLVPLTAEGEGFVGEVELEVPAGVDEAWIVAAVLPDDVAGTEVRDGETWTWRAAVEAAPGDTGAVDTAPTDDTGGDPVAERPGEKGAQGCGCAGAPGGGAGGLLLLVGALMARRLQRSRAEV